jgi:hypothetical protein
MHGTVAGGENGNVHRPQSSKQSQRPVDQAAEPTGTPVTGAALGLAIDLLLLLSLAGVQLPAAARM